MKATFLSAEVPLTKTFTLEKGELKKSGHPRIIDCTSYEVDFETIEDLHNHMLAHAELGHCFLKGNLTRQIINESRAGATDPNEPTRVILLDLDGLKEVSTVDQFMTKVGLQDVDHIVQYSSSMGVIPDRGLSAHIYVLLDRAWPPAMLKQWLIHLNLSIKELRNGLGLTRTNNALRWALDVTTCQNDKLIYIAPPICGNGVVDGFEGERIALVKRTKRVASISEKIPSAEVNRVAMEKALNSLRADAGLKERKKTTYKTQGTVEYMAKPDQAVVTSVRTERGFTYLNINNGDSWGYYHPENNPEFIYNFKGEPVYKTSELIPDYWHDVKEIINIPRLDNKGMLYLAFRDFRTATYWNGIWNSVDKSLVMSQAKSAEQLRHFLKQHGQPVGDFIPDWNVVFNPQSEDIITIESRTVNQFQPSEFMTGSHKKVTKVPPIVKKVIMHMVGDDEACFEHLMNWLAVIIQHRCKTGTAWVFNGIQGTGKGLFLNKILRPLYKYVESKRMRELDSQFNGYLEKCLILWLDEAQMSAQNQAGVMEADVKNYIVEDKISIRRMQTNAYEAESYLNIMLASNKDDPITIDVTDRRFNVTPFQDRKLEISDAELAELQNTELRLFADYLFTRAADKGVARTPMNNPAKQKMVYVGLSSIDVAAKNLLEGNLEFFKEQEPADHLNTSKAVPNSSRDILAGAYINLLKQIEEGKKPILIREDIHIMLDYIIGNVPNTPYKFSSMLKHHKIFLEPSRIDGKVVRGLKVNWKLPEKDNE